MRKFIFCIVGAVSFMVSVGCQSIQANEIKLKPTKIALPIELHADNTYLTLQTDTEFQKVDRDKVSIKEKLNKSRSRHADLIIQQQSAQLSFKHAKLAKLSWHSKQAVDIESFIEQGSISMTLLLDEFDKASLSLVLSCGTQCESKVILNQWAKSQTKQDWRQLTVPLSCFKRPTADYKNLTSMLSLETKGTGKIQVKDVEIMNQTSHENLLLTCPDPEKISTTAQPQDEDWSRSWWMKRHQQKVNLAQKTDPDLVLLGDSITHHWEKSGKQVWQKWFADINTLNLGFSGDRTENVLWRIRNGEISDINPKLVILMIGTNNTGHRMEAPEDIVKGIEQIIVELQTRLPNSKILLLDIFPRGATAADLARINNAKVNQLLKPLAAEKKIRQINLNSIFLDEAANLPKSIMPDALHPNKTGYQLWAKALAPYIRAHIKMNQ